jgi:hypothetical protein
VSRTGAETYEVDAGLRAYMLGIYNYMAGGVALTGIVAYAVNMWATSNPDVAATLYASPLRWVILFAPLAMVFFLSFRVHALSLAATQLSFWIYSALVGLSLSGIFLTFTDESIARIFFITAAMFGAISIWGYTTKTDISGWGSFLWMGLIGLIIAGLVNIFMQSSALQWASSVIAVLVFAGFTAYDTQRLKSLYYEVQGDVAAMGKSAVMGALSLYLDFLNMFLALLSLFGNRE